MDRGSQIGETDFEVVANSISGKFFFEDKYQGLSILIYNIFALQIIIGFSYN